MTPFEKLLVAHLVGDWILAQTDWEATNKAKNWFACISHAFKWFLCIVAGMVWVNPVFLTATRSDMLRDHATLYWAMLAMGILHAIIDRRTPVRWLMRAKEYIPFGYHIMAPGHYDRNGRSMVDWKKVVEPPFWLVVCVDQVLHIVQVAILASLL